jgi:signal transduction histidine kinase
MAMFVAHEFGDGRLGGVHISGLDRVVPFVAFFIPILYAALSFGFWGSVATTALATALALVDVWLDAPYYSVVELGLNLFQVALFDVVSVLIGERVEAEQIARTTARAAVRGERSAKERYQALFEGSGAPIIMLDATGTITETNYAARSLFKRPDSPLVGDHLNRIVGERTAGQLLSGEPENAVTVRTEEHGTLLFHLARSEAVDDSGAQVFQVVFQDMTEQHLRHRHAAAFALALMRGQEDERRRIAQELHDQPVQSLIYLCRGLDGVRDDDALPEKSRNRLLHVRHTVQEIIESLRRIARGLRPPALDDLGLEACVRRLVDDLQERPNLATAVRFPDHLARLTPEIELALFRIAQEALSNVARHSSASSVSVAIDINECEIALTVDDDGIGFENPNLINDPAYIQLGLIGMTERAELLGGRLEIVSAPNCGTHLRAIVPLTTTAPATDIASVGSRLG